MPTPAKYTHAKRRKPSEQQEEDNGYGMGRALPRREPGLIPLVEAIERRPCCLSNSQSMIEYIVSEPGDPEDDSGGEDERLEGEAAGDGYPCADGRDSQAEAQDKMRPACETFGI